MWIQLTDFPLYEISNTGIVRNIKTGKVIKPYLTHNGYHAIKLVGVNGRSGARIHRLVAMTYIDNPQGKEYVNHINGDKNDNSVHNLEWVTMLENNQHAYDTGLKQQTKALNPEQVAAIRSEFVKGSFTHGANTLGRKYGVSKTTILKALKPSY